LYLARRAFVSARLYLMPGVWLFVVADYAGYAFTTRFNRIRCLRRKLLGLPQLSVARQRSGVRERHAHGDWLCATARRAAANSLTR